MFEFSLRFGRGDAEAKAEPAAVEEKTAGAHTMESVFTSGGGIFLGSGGGYQKAYDNSWVAYSCIRRQALDASGIPLVFLSDPDDSESELPASHPVPQLFARPNRLFDSREFIQSLVTWILYRGEFFVAFDNPIRPTEMRNWGDPLHWKPNGKGTTFDTWIYQHQMERWVESDENILRHRFIDPANPVRGQAPLRAAARAYSIDVGVDVLQEDIVKRGGERGILYETKAEMTDPQRRQTAEDLRSRRGEANKVGKDVLLPNNIGVVDPRFIEDDLRILESQKMTPDKICAVYGMSKSLLGFEDIDKYATFKGRMKVYAHQTLIPMLTGIEGAFDSWFVRRARPSEQCYVRFDYSKVPALQSDTAEQFETAIKSHAGGLPWTVCNERFDLSLDTDKIPGADTVMISSTLAPMEGVLDTWDEKPPAPEPANDPEPGVGDSDAPGDDEGDDEGKMHGCGSAPRRTLTQKLVEKRARNPRQRIQRQMRMIKLEKSLRAAWKTLIFSAARKAGTTSKSIEKQRAPTKAAALKLIRGYHEKGALEGEESILELVTGKMSDAERDAIRKTHRWDPAVGKWFDARTKYIVDMVDDLFSDVKAAALAGVRQGEGVAEVETIVRSRFHAASGGINRAVTIARTELGSAYNFARFTEMGAQGFEKHKWLTNGDEKVREGESDPQFDHVACDGKVRARGDTFPCGLEYPMEDGGDAGNVINCRCETIPIVEGLA